MPVPKGTRYRVKTNPDGSKVRLAIKPGGEVIEAKKLPAKRKEKRHGR